MAKKLFQIEGMHCASCALLIDEELEELSGIRRARTSYARQQAEVEYDEQQVNEQKIIATISGVGYKVSAVKTA
ncbi:MAG: heavy-metal-associated domain-containing protein [Chloroflexi bacterium]|uniref:Copper chaperone CopZ n=1 Tax=Candidatus Chlorohelix allophototropha TaxID=3003348 RepID=A0A8T7M447_9CHLR|nr:heavy-metal-associated domain-containing protein [Chloroflexota bacterium]WJW70155.1 cation transporter [Chloroflexota bacterium L227-S17]